MESRRALAWSARYFLISAVFALVGAVLIGAGVGYGGLQAWSIYQQTGNAMVATQGVAVYIALAVVGILVWRFGKAFALYATLTGAIEEQLSDTFDTEHVKSDIVAILDERLADMQQDIQSINREIRDVKKESEFEFQGE